MSLPYPVGNSVRRADGSYGLVHATEQVAERQPMVNLSVAEAHTFFVGEAGWLVHNSGGLDFDSGQLSEHNRQLRKYGQAGIRILQNGCVRYYSPIKPARNPGPMQGTRRVREWNPGTGRKRTWLETLDHNHCVRIVRPETGGPKVHYQFDDKGNYLGSF